MKYLFLTIIFSFGFWSLNAQDYGKAPKKNKTPIKEKPDKNSDAKGIYFYEDFDEGFPTYWTLFNEGDDDYTWYVRMNDEKNLDGTPYLWVDADEAGTVQLEETMISPEFDTEGATNLFLAFDQRYNTLGSTVANVKVWDGTQWVMVVDNTAETDLVGNWGEPDRVLIDITEYANSDMKLRFYFYSYFEWGWALDNIKVYSPDYTNDLSLEEAGPEGYLRKDSANTITAQVYNNGAETISSFTAELEVKDKNMQTVESFSQLVSDTLIVQNAFYEFEFDDELIVTEEGEYSLHFSITNPDDEEADNNTFTSNVEVFQEYLSFAINSGTDQFERVLIPFGSNTELNSIDGFNDYPMAMDFTDEKLLLVRFSKTLVEIDTLTGTETEIGEISIGNGTLTGITYNTDNGMVYLSLINETDDASFMYELNIETLETNELGKINDGQVIAIEYAADGYIYCLDIFDDALWRYNLQTLEAESVGPIGTPLNYGQDISYNIYDNQLYGMLYYSSLGGSRINILDMQTGAQTEFVELDSHQYSTFAMPFSGGNLEVYIHDTEANPLEDAQILFSEMLFSSNSFGEIDKFLAEGTYDYTASKSGYESVNGSFEITENGITTLDIELTEAVNVSELEADITLSPNPVKDKAMLYLPEGVLSENASLKIRDISGKLILHKNLSPSDSEISIDLNKESSGIYFLEIETSTGLLSKKIVKQ